MTHPAQTVVLTGVGRVGQVGEFVAHRFGERNFALAIIDRTASEADARAMALREAGFQAKAYPCDLSDDAQVQEAAARIIGEGSDIAALINMAGGFAMSGDIAESDPAQWKKQFDINYTTAYLATRAFLPALRRTRGAIVYFASVAALPSGVTKGMAAYAAAKGAVVTLMRAVAEQEATTGVRSNAVAPSAIRTAKNEKSMGTDAAYVERIDVAEAVLFLCSESARAVSGQVIELRRTRR
jgi:NAD(P)-dependent dehydrogenase (short-subunit alcohol dehydrogenase family)